ncbi:MAG: CDP-glycerol glycerophosphotransferase family protein [Clostridia bacterium]|nr:CDP-glycerol glycerophosphotransferase family protein [Clostridia bacterium]
MDYSLTLTQLYTENQNLIVGVSGFVSDPTLPKEGLFRPKVVLFFDNGVENRRIPLVIKEIQQTKDGCHFFGVYIYRLNYLFWRTRQTTKEITLQFHLTYGNQTIEGASFDLESTLLETDERYWHAPKIQNNTVLLTPIAHRSAPAFCKVILAPFRALVWLCNLLIAICLLPWFLVEAILSFLGMATLDSKVKTTNPLRRIVGHVNARSARFTNQKLTITGVYRGCVIALFHLFCLLPLQKNRITFISMRRNDLTGNFAFVYDQLKDRKDLKIKFILSYRPTAWIPPLTLVRFCHACAVSKVIVLDEFTPQIHYFNLRKKTRLVQLWHACGAFKTFGFTRIDKPMGSPQNTRMHRSYDYVTVSSSYCKKCHSEGFGISEDNVVPTGIARTDIFFDEAYKARVKQEFFEQYPALQGKKILLFAPTFRGNVKETAHYPMEQFDLKAVYEAIGSDYAIIIKHHPFVKETHPIPEEYQDVILDLSNNSELNDLLLISHAVITDYSSLIFEAALIGLNMLFYVYDLQEYIRDRDFYFDLSLNAPGKLVYTQQEVIDAVVTNDYQPERMEQFAHMFFDHFDGQSSRRVADLIRKAVQE